MLLKRDRVAVWNSWLVGKNINRDTYSKILTRLTSRGPDGSGQWSMEGVWLGHRRLAVLDLSSQAQQPMVSSSKRLILTYNGEIYNYLDLRAELMRNGVYFRSKSDTEVALGPRVSFGG